MPIVITLSVLTQVSVFSTSHCTGIGQRLAEQCAAPDFTVMLHTQQAQMLVQTSHALGTV